MPSLTPQEVERRFFELLASTIIDFKPLNVWIRGGEEVRLPFFTRASPDEVQVFEARASLPPLSGARWLLRIDISGNGLLIVNGEPYQGVDEQHRLVALEPGEQRLVLKATPRRLFGESPWVFAFMGSCLTAVLWEGFNLALSLLDALQLARSRPELMEALARAAEEIEVTPSIMQVYALIRTLYGHLIPERSPEYRGPRWDLAYVASVYGERVLEGALNDTLRPVLREVVETVERVKAALPQGSPVGRVYLFGHSHIDTAWLWPFSETKRKVVRTFSTVVRLAKMGYAFTYVQSGAQNYKWLEEQSPELFEEVRRLVEEGRWLPVGGMWVECDTQLVTGESLARQFLYGQLYFKEKLGRRCRIGWLPDSFGFSAQLPQLLRKAGLDVFVTHKVMWNDTNEFPYHAFVWEGLDGSEVVAHVLVLTYNGVLTASELVRLWERYKQKDLAPAVHSYGFGDGGGGPTFLMLERLKLLKRLPGLPELIEAPSEEEYVAELLRVKDKLPRWRGEIYNEFHRGVYTTNLKVKTLMAVAESEARWAEAASSAASLLGLAAYPSDELREAWERVLRCQFHDVLPGSSNREAYEEAYRDLEKAIAAFTKISSEALRAIAESVNAPRGSIVIFNSLSWPMRALVKLPSSGYTLPDGRPLEVQEFGGEYLAEVEVPAMGYTTLIPGSGRAARGGAAARVEDGGIVLENEVLRVRVSSDGSIASIYDKQLGVEYLASPSNVLRAHVDKPGQFDAWDVDRSTIESPGHTFKVVEGPRVVARGPLMAAVEYELKFRNSTIRQRVALYRGSRLVELKTEIDWREKCYLVKAWFHFNVGSEVAHYEVPFGVVERRTVPRSRWDEAKYEVPALRWADFSDGEKGVAIIAPTRHGYSARGSRVGLSLLKSPMHPNPWSDLGRHEVTYYLYPHPGDYRASRVYERAYEVWSGVKAVVKERDGGRLPLRASLLEAPRGLIVEALKVSEDGEALVLRIYEIEGRDREGVLRLATPLRAYEANLLEERQIFLAEGSEIRVRLKPFEVKTLLLKR
ncbi:MAG: alpha-mannosidase [Thermoprotei archaeon]|nr:MAG: alpha-mannosidase [Thermoprotei archaeon]